MIDLASPRTIAGLRPWLAGALLLVAIQWLLPSPASAAPTQQIVELRAADGRAVPALVIYPEGGPDSAAPVAIFHHGGPGGHPLRAISASRWGAEYFAKRGYVTISLLSRISRDVIDQPFGAGVADIKGAVDWASQLTTGPIVLVGHSSGSVSITLYMATTQDPRVKALVHFAPTAWGSGWMVRSMGQARYDGTVARLRRLVKEGKGDQPIYEDHRLAPPAPQDITYGYLMSARTWLSWWGPDSRNRNIELFPKVRVPMLMISGDTDIFVSREYQLQLKAAAVASPRVDAIMLDGGIPHEFTGAEAKAAGLAFDWLNEIGITPKLRINTRIVDLKVGFGSSPGLIYEPTDPARRKPVALMLMPDFADDVMVTPLGKLAPELARAGYTVLVPQDRGSGWPFYRSVASTVSADQQAWIKYLGEQGYPRIAIVAHGWAGTMVPALIGPRPDPRIAGVALIQPPLSPAQFAREALGMPEYDRAVARARAAVAQGEGGTTMIVAPFRTNGRDPASRRWINHMAAGFLSFWGPDGLAAPIPALQETGLPLMLVEAGQGRFVRRDARADWARQPGVSALWYDQAASPLESSEQLSANLAAWLDQITLKPAKRD